MARRTEWDWSSEWLPPTGYPDALDRVLTGMSEPTEAALSATRLGRLPLSRTERMVSRIKVHPQSTEAFNPATQKAVAAITALLHRKVEAIDV